MPEPRHILKQFELHAKKRLSQNFIRTPGVLKRIADTLEPGPEDTVVEIGPGLGALTLVLAPRCGHLIALEKDPDLIPVLAKVMGKDSTADIREADAMEVDLPDIPEKLLLAGNLPYQIASRLMFHLLQTQRRKIRRMVFMFQKEVGERIVAAPGSKQYGILSVLSALYCDTKLVFVVSPGHFHPRPKVSSAVLRFDVLEKPRLKMKNHEFFFEMVKACLAHRRKTLRNNLNSWMKPVLIRDVIKASLDQIELDLGRRAETLSLEEFHHLYKILVPILT